jgi:polysaccharide biosynthesis/export protein
VSPEDVLYVYRDTPKFTAFGALGSAGQTSGLTGLFAFEQEQLALNEALAKAGGLQDGRANPSQVFLYRVEYREVLEKTGVNLSAFEPDQKLIPTVYRANFRDPSFYFAAQRFKLRNKDVLYVANADANEIGKFLGFVRTVTGTVGGVATDYTAARGVFNQGGGTTIRVN